MINTARCLFLPLILVLLLVPVGGESVVGRGLADTPPASAHAPVPPNPSRPAHPDQNATSHSRTDGTPKHPSPPKHTFVGTLENVDLPDHPMTVVVVHDRGRPSEFVFGGALNPRTDVLRKGKTVGVNSLKPGEKVAVSYHTTPDGPLVEQIRILH